MQLGRCDPNGVKEVKALIDQMITTRKEEAPREAAVGGGRWDLGRWDEAESSVEALEDVFL